MSFLINAWSELSGAVGSAVRSMMPVAVQMAIVAGFQDQRIGKIVGGTEMAISGAYIVTKTLQSWLWKKKDREETTAKVTTRWGAAIVGLSMTCYGIYSIGSGVSELKGFSPQPPPESTIELAFSDPSEHELGDATKRLIAKDLESCETRLELAKDRLLSCPDAQKLFEEVRRQGPVSFGCTTPIQAPTGALVYLDKRQILVSNEVYEIVPKLLFELNNLKRSEMGTRINQQPCQLTADHYALSIEKLEWGSAHDTHDISDQCVDHGFWPEQWRTFHQEFFGPAEKNWHSFEGYRATQEYFSHTDIYRMRWYERCNLEGLTEWVEANSDRWYTLMLQLVGEA
jgi:hypothetical protein